jgi:hypothetical protein
MVQLLLVDPSQAVINFVIIQTKGFSEEAIVVGKLQEIRRNE